MLPLTELAKSASFNGGPSSESVELSSSKNCCRAYICALSPSVAFLLSDSIILSDSAEVCLSSRICLSAWANCASIECTSVPSRLLIWVSSSTFCSSWFFSACNSSMWSFSSANAFSVSFIPLEVRLSSSIFASSIFSLPSHLASEFFTSLTASSFDASVSFNNKSSSSTCLSFSPNLASNSAMRTIKPSLVSFSSSIISSICSFPFFSNSL